jgi:uncharacterized protein (DUF885 family)
MVWPAQALSYKIGALKIQELRKRAQDALGEKFSYPQFHAVVIGDGTLPLPIWKHASTAGLQRRADALAADN